MFGFAKINDISSGSDGKASFAVYNVHMNGFYHSSLRYSQLLELQNELKVNFDTTLLEPFPPKHWTSLSDAQQTQRRVMLERFVQSVCQNRVIGPSEMVKEFWLGAQRACSDLTAPSGDLDVYLVNGKKVTLTVQSSDRADQVLEQVCRHIDMNSDLTYYFGLFLEREADNTLMCPVTDYQSPLITVHTANSQGIAHRLTLRQHFWDGVFVPELLTDKVAKNMLYIEALANVARGHLELTAEDKEKLTGYKNKGLKKEYLECVSAVSQFGYRQLQGFTFNHPVEGMEGCVRVGKQEMVTYTNHGPGVWAQCSRYPLTRIRSWKVGRNNKTGVPWLHMNCQLGKDQFVWVELSGELSIFLNLCLHSTVNELLRARSKAALRTPGTHPINRTTRELPRYVITHLSGAELESSESEGQGSLEEPSTPTSNGHSGAQSVDSTDSGPITPKVSTDSASQKTASDRKDSATKRKVSTSDLKKRKDSKPTKKAAARQSAPFSLFKKAKSPTETENETFNFGTDDDL